MPPNSVEFHKLLIVDDSSSLRTVVKLALVRAGYEVLEAGDGVQGLAQLEALLVT